ncbi:MAG: symmetrical bis(5'-nucleosyl)-tetraphosphatase [Gammaproteobacteria bacterium]|jgi:bis(5'-nucleosyl)-tetraphosphatase (symmetrical)|nr:symmetrical bis(5'-nucleosyl)-tetraphosphatase [Gammaproteobacteria bacterium]
MSTYAIGDIQGCQQELVSLLDEINFNENKDRLWFTGDLVNRGPNSLETLRFIKKLGDSAITVLGNHDLHLLAIANGQSSYMHKGDTLKEILQATDKDELLGWLLQRPLFHQDKSSGFIMVHAGLAPQWTIAQASALASEVESVLRGDNYTEFFAHMYGNTPDTWSEKLQGWERLRVITNYFTRLRYCEPDGKMNFSEKNTPGKQAAQYQPWFEIENRRSANIKLVFGHWAALRNYKIDYLTYNVYPLDTGCLWGGDLTALRLEDEKWFSVPSLQEKWFK